MSDSTDAETGTEVHQWGRWEGAFGQLQLSVEAWIDRIGLYPWWARPVFERKLHYVARLAVANGVTPRSQATSPP